ncbi:MAG: hypothetical protein K8S18_04940 [Desulfobacula sp.]|nr:hypothetical protein [Desulfobacula sp.]
MTTSISIKPSEKGTAVATIAPTDEDGVALTIGQLTNPQWQLMKTDGTIVNDRAFASCALTALSWVLQGADLAIFGSSDSGNRVLSVQATYDSSLGSGLPLRGECKFTIDRLVGQEDES